MKLVFILYPQALTTGVSIPAEMFQAAAQFRQLRRRSVLEVICVAETLAPVATTAGLSLLPSATFEEINEADYLFLPPMWGTPWKVLGESKPLQRWVRQRYTEGSRIVATGTGVGHLAETGLLNDRVATSHWYYLDRFTKRYPEVKFQRDHFVTHQDGIYCAGSINAQTDLVLFLIERHFGEEALALVEQQFMHEIKGRFSTPYYEPGGRVHQDESVALVQSWMRTHLGDNLTSLKLAEIAGLSERQLRRRFQAATGLSPLSYLNQIRIEEAQSLLRESNLPVADIAHATGFASAAYFTQSFRKQVKLSPMEYRTLVRKKLFSL